MLAEILEQSGSQPGEKIFGLGQLTQEDINGIEKFVFFIGWPRSGHSIVGTLMDAHPNMLIADGFGIFRQLMTNRTKTTKDAIYNALYEGSKSSLKGKGSRKLSKKGYSLGVDRYWQGNFTNLKVIGDKNGLGPVMLYTRSPEKFKKLYTHLSADVLQIPLKVIQVIRIPYDIAATIALYGQFKFDWKTNGSICTENNKCKVRNGAALYVRTRSKIIQRMRKDLDLPVLDIHGADLVHQPRQTMERICQFVDVVCYEEYLDTCEEKVFEKVSKTRNLVEWAPDQLAMVDNTINDYPFFQRHTFYSD